MSWIFWIIIALIVIAIVVITIKKSKGDGRTIGQKVKDACSGCLHKKQPW
jgi:hypothetical protein